jgi:hypothetical protein
VANFQVHTHVDASQVSPQLKALIGTLTNRSRFVAEWASKTASMARRSAVAHGSGGGFWERDIAVSVEIESVSGDAFVVRTRSPLAIHKQFGGKIRATKAKFLTIPIAPEAQGKRASELSGGHRDLFRVEGKSGKAVLGYDDGSRFHPLFVLVREVNQKAEPWWPTAGEVEALGVTIAEKNIGRQQS